MGGTSLAQAVRNGMNVGGQFVGLRSIGSPPPFERGRGTLGGLVVHLSAAKYKHRAGPVTMRSASALSSKAGSSSRSAFACVRDDLR